jgi:hypothetical protein
MDMTEEEFFATIKNFIVPPFNPDIENIPAAEKPKDFDEWYRENNRL